MDRPPRNVVGLLTLFIAALGSVAVIGAEHQRSTVNTVILVVAALAAAGSLLALLIGSVWFGVLRKDLAEWWDQRPSRKLDARHYPAREPAPNVFDFDLGPNEAKIRAEGMPCMITALGPRTSGLAEDRLFKDVTASCTIERRGTRSGRPQTIQVKPYTDDAWGTMARWPPEWFDLQTEGPVPGTYLVRWLLHRPDGRTERLSERLRILLDGQPKTSLPARAMTAASTFVQHYRGRD
jgi:hypothetical protein